jgi:hypothetical protein
MNLLGFISLEFIILIFILLFMIFALNKRQSIYDWVRLIGYRPPQNIVNLANSDTMNAYTRHLFYLNRPQLLPTVISFRQNCPENEDIIVLGCYHSGQNGIFIYNVQDPALAGVQQVTAAHEVLHSVYARLSDQDRKTLDNELQDFDLHGLQNSQVKAEVKLYQQTEPNDVYDEMSCTFGTEIANLPPALNAYYAKYFTNRMAIVGFEQQYQGQLISKQTIITSDDAQLQTMKNNINSDESELTSELNSLNTAQATLLSEQNSNVSAYNAAIPNYNQQVDSYNSLINTTQSLIRQYNLLVVSRNNVASQLTTLDNALDTRLVTKAAK